MTEYEAFFSTHHAVDIKRDERIDRQLNWPSSRENSYALVGLVSAIFDQLSAMPVLLN